MRVKDTDINFECANYGAWREINKYCPTLEGVFHQSVNGSGGIRPYSINSKDPRLRKLMSEIDRIYEHPLETNVLDAVSSLVKEIRKTLHTSMSKKKKLEVQCIWR